MMSAKTPLVSVYVVTYNQEKYLRECLDGIVMQQTDFPFEAIVIDDASTDGNLEIIKEYAERYPEIIKPVLLEENLWNQGINKFFAVFLPRAKGKYIAFCEGDDYWTYEGKLQRQVDFLEKHPDYSMCFHNFSVKNETDLKYGYRRLIKSRDAKIEDLILCQVVQEATVLSRRSSIEKDIELKDDILSKKFQFSDIRFYLSYIHTGKVYGIAEKWSVYRVQNKGVSTILRNRNQLKSNHINIIRALSQCYKEKYKRLYNQLVMRDKLSVSYRLIIRKKLFKSILFQIKALKISPNSFIRLYFSLLRTQKCLD